MPATHPVTVVVPAYGDPDSLFDCVASLVATVDQKVHRVLLVNDVGPLADEIEARLLSAIAGQPGFTYERNPQNLGFVGTCNRAALELDATDNDILLLNSDTVATAGFIQELSAVLYSSPDTGAVCPRSNNATIASLPYKLRDPSVGRDPERTLAVHGALARLMPASSISPVAMGFCLLIRRDLIRRFGLFDEAYAPGYGEENDFCLRIGAEGFVSRIAHHAVVLHVGSRSFSRRRRDALRAAHERLLVSRYPAYPAAVRDYIFAGRDVVDVFADALLPGDDIRAVLIDVMDTGAPTRALLAAAHTTSQATEITVTASGAALRFAQRHAAGVRVVDRAELDGQWDLALIVASSVTDEQTAALNRTCLRWVLAVSKETAPLDYVDEVVALTELSSLDALIDRHARSAVDIDRLRSRWQHFARSEHQSAPRESRQQRLRRTAERVAPRLTDRAVGVAKRVLRRF